MRIFVRLKRRESRAPRTAASFGWHIRGARASDMLLRISASRPAAAALALCLLITPVMVASSEIVIKDDSSAYNVVESVSYVFGDSPDYEHASDGLQIGVKRVQEDDITYFVADIRLDSAERLKTAKSSWYATKKGAKSEAVSVIAARNEAVLAINADNFKNHSYGVIVREGEILRKKATNRHVLLISDEGDMLEYADASDVDMLLKVIEERGVREGFSFGPVLVKDGQAVDFPKSFKLIATRDSILEPRTAIGQLGPLHYIVIVVDGRREGYSEGINLRGLQELFLRYGAVQAFNLDGGGSTTLYFNGEVINTPSGGGERKVTDILYFN